MAKRIHNQPRHPLSNKYTPYAQYTIEDIKGFLTPMLYSSCVIRNPTMQPLGRVRLGVWYILQEYYTTKKGVRRRREVRVIEVLYLNFLGRPFTTKEQIHQFCQTKGCLNLHHYELRGDKVMVNYDQVLTIYEQAIIKGELTIPLNDSVQARAFRLACYPHKRAMKQRHPQLYEQIHGVYELVIRQGNLICRKKGFSSDIQAAWAAAGLPTQSNTKEQEELLTRSMQELRDIEQQGGFDADPLAALLNKQKAERDNPPTDSKPDSA